MTAAILFDLSLFSNTFVVCMQALGDQLVRRGNARNLLGAHYAFGLSYGSGELLTHEELVIPLDPSCRGAILGADGYFGLISPSAKVTVADGSAAKLLFWNAELEEFFQRVAELSDVVVFVVPPHLRRITIRGWSGDQVRLVIPGEQVESQWPAVLPVLAGAVSRILDRYQRVTVIVQASLMSATLSMLLELMRPQHPGNTLRYFDLGQVLDVAAYPSAAAGPWTRRRDVQEALGLQPPQPIFLSE